MKKDCQYTWKQLKSLHRNLKKLHPTRENAAEVKQAKGDLLPGKSGNRFPHA